MINDIINYIKVIYYLIWIKFISLLNNLYYFIFNDQTIVNLCNPTYEPIKK